MRKGWTRQVLAAVLVNSIYEMKNYPIVLVNTVLSPISFLLVIAFVSRGQLIGEGIEGGLIMSMFSSGMGLQADLSHLKNDFKLQDMIVSSPTTSALYVTGITIAELVYSLPALIVLAILAWIFLPLGPLQVLELLGVLFLMFLTSVALGFTLATVSSDIVESFAFSRLLSTLFSTLPPVYYPITYIPLPYRYIAYLSPTTYAAEIAQSAAGYLSVSGSHLALDWAVLLVVTGALFWISKSKARWREP
jgi:ABC-2 type transport system permease protein